MNEKASGRSVDRVVPLRPGGRGAPRRGARWRAAFRGLGLLAALALAACTRGGGVGGSCDASRATAPRDVVLIVIDTLRADHLSTYGYARPTAPNLDSFAREAIRYENAISPGTWTVPSHASMFTGHWPSFHGAERMAGERILAQPIRADAGTLAEILGRQGFHTAAFVGNYVFVSPSFGFSRGFAEFFKDGLYYPPELTKQFSSWLAPRSDRLFVFVNVLDPHEPYEPPPPLDQKFPTKRPEYGTLMTKLVHGGTKVTPEMAEHFVSQYDGEIIFADRAVGEIFAALREAGRYDDALVIVTSDHGEFLGEFGMAGHGQSPFEPQVRVPLLVKMPGGCRAGETVERRVSTRSVFATIHRALGLEMPAGVDARPLDEPHEVWVEDVDSSGNRIRAGYDGSMKLVATTTPQETFTWLYDLATDPSESRAVRDGSGGEGLRLALQRFAATPRPVNPSVAPPIDAEREAQLRALGYIQ